MKLFNLFFLVSLFFAQPTNAQVFWQDDFELTTPEMGGGTRTSSIGDAQNGTCCGSDRFLRTEGVVDASCCGCFFIFTGLSGSWAWSGEDLDGGTSPCLDPSQTITWTGIDITGRTNLEFIGLFGINDGTSWELADQFKIEYRIDGGSLVEGYCFSPDVFPNNDLALDANCDLTVDGDYLALALTEHTFSIPSTGTTLEIVFTANVNGGGEEFVVDNFRLNEGVALPIKLNDFTATLKNKTTLLKWQTETEENNDYFQIEHSLDGKNFMALSMVQGNGNTLRPIDYSFLHEHPNVGVNYYRLKQVDYDGAFSYSNIEAVDLRSKKKVSAIYPNPFYQSLTIQFPSSEYNSSVEVRTIEVFDALGKLVFSNEVPMNAINVTLDLSILNSGVYFVQTSDGQYSPTEVQRIIKL